jgi:hypothetical protein
METEPWAFLAATLLLVDLFIWYKEDDETVWNSTAMLIFHSRGIDTGNTNYGAPEQTINGQARYGLKGATPQNWRP